MLDQVLAGNEGRLAPFTLAAPDHPLRSGGGSYMALRFETVGWSNAEFWMRYQACYDLENVRIRARKRAESVVAETRC